MLEELGLEGRLAAGLRDESHEGPTGGLPPGVRPHPPDPLLAALHGETLDAGALARVLGVEVSEVLVRLVQLELRGRVVRSPGGLYRLAERGG